MLQRITVSNLALISKTEIEFCANLNVLSGETGAGKSIVVDGIALLLGARYDKTLLRFGCESGYVEGVFDATERAKEVMSELGLEVDDLIIINRKFFADGKNDIRINGRSVTTLMLKSVTATLVDIYGQHEYQSLANKNEHLKILDYFIRDKVLSLKEKIKDEYYELKKVNAQLKDLGDETERERNVDLLSYQIDEIESAKIGKTEESDLIEYRKKVTSAEKIASALGTLTDVIYDADENVSAILSRAKKALTHVCDVSEQYNALYARLDSVEIELNDIAETAREYLDEVNFDFDELEKIENRLEKIRSIKRKYGDYDKMQKHLLSAKERLNTLVTADEVYEKLLNKKTKLIDSLYSNSVKLHEVRLAGAKELANEIVSQLNDLSFDGAKFSVEIPPVCSIEDCEKNVTINGLDVAEFYLSPNVGQPLKPLTKIISGGELSRFMLALKVISSKIDDIPTMVYDEIDVGISGKTGQEVAKKLAVISREHQILCVTHLPQIASMADNHYYINKSVHSGETETNVLLLDYDGMVEEISRLSGAKDISSTSSANAQQMKKWSYEFKSKVSI